MHDDESAQAEEIDRLLLSSLRYWEPGSGAATGPLLPSRLEPGMLDSHEQKATING